MAYLRQRVVITATVRVDMAITRRYATHLLAVLTAVCISLSYASSAQAHNSLTTSEPADESILVQPPSQWSLTFTGDVPLESASGELVLSDGTRLALSPPTHGASTSTIVFPLPAGLMGPISARWRLVGTDGHVISGRVQFQIENTPPSTEPSSTTTTSLAPVSQLPPATISPTTAAELPQTTADETPISVVPMSPMVDPIPEGTRWPLQGLSYLGLIICGGLLFAEVAVAPGILRRRRALLAFQGGSLLLFIIPAILSLIYIADVKGVRLSRAPEHLFELFTSTSGSMLAVRTAVGLLLVMTTLAVDQLASKRQLIHGALALVIVHIVTSPFTGHSWSMRWRTIGVTADIVHLGAITIWIGGLFAIVFFVLPAARTGNAVIAYIRFSRYAAWSLAAIVATGLVQTVRLHGGDLSSFNSTHGLLLGIKVLLVGVMIVPAWKSRLALSQRVSDADLALRSHLLRVTAFETGLGVLILFVSAALIRASFTG